MMANIGSQFEKEETCDNYKDLYDDKVKYLNN